jgi:hypothetical protein
MNPLADLCRKMGVGIADAARLAGVNAGSANIALLADPTPAVDAYIKISAALGASLKVRKGAPLAFWFYLPTFDALYFDRLFRLRQGLPGLPASRLKLRQYVISVRRRKVKSYAKLVKDLERGHICTAEGLRDWRRSTIGQYLKLRRNPDGAHEALAPNAQCIADWRDYLKGLVHGAICPEDVMAPVRYLMAWKEDGGRLYLEAGKEMPEKPREWIIAAVSRIPWLTAGHWGLIDPTTMQKPQGGPGPLSEPSRVGTQTEPR